MDIYIHKSGRDLGPFTAERVKEGLAHGDFSRSDHAWREGLADWIPLGDIIQSAAAQALPPNLPAAPSPAGGAQNNTAHIFVVRNGTALGPFTAAEVITQMEAGIFTAADVATHSGSETLGPVLAVPGIVPPKFSWSEQTHLSDAERLPSGAKQFGGFWVRVAAIFVDSLVLYIPHLIVAAPIAAILQDFPDRTDPAARIGADLALLGPLLLDSSLYWLYFAIAESSSWQGTVGKKLFGLRVTNLAGDRISFGQATGRYFSKCVSALILGIGFLMAAFTERKRALHDFMAGTLVVRNGTSSTAKRVGTDNDQRVSDSRSMDATASTDACVSGASSRSYQSNTVEASINGHSGDDLPSVFPFVAIFAFFVLMIAGGVLMRKSNNASSSVQAPNPVNANPHGSTEQNVIRTGPGAQSSARPQASAEAPPAVTTSPLGDLSVQRRKSDEQIPEADEIWLACTDGSRPPEHLCEHDWRSGQVSFSPDEHWIVVTDGGGPGSSMGTTLRAFYRRTQNLYREMENAGIEDRAAGAALRQHNAPQGAELDHTYAEVEGWSSDGGVLNVNVWGHGAGYGHLDPTMIEIDMSMIRANYHRSDPEVATAAPVRVSPQNTIAPETARREREGAATNQADAELNTVYARLMAAYDPVRQKQLRNEERTWLIWRDKEADLIARNSITPANDYETGRVHVLTDLTEQRTRVLKAALEHLGVGMPAAANSSRTPTPLVEQRSPAVRPIDEGRSEQGNRRSILSRVYTLPELKTLVGTRPSGAGLRGDFVVVRREGSQILLQSRADMQRWGITGTTNGQEDVYLGHTFVTVNCSRDMSRFINGKLVTIPAEQALQIISVSKNSQGQINVEASF